MRIIKLRALLSIRVKCFFSAAIFLGLGPEAAGQTISHLNDLSSFKDPGKTWRLAGNVYADLNRPNILNVSAGSGILVNLPDKKTHGIDLFTTEDFGDMDLELDYLMAKGSNSGIYLQGRYEIQLHDSWTVKNPTSGNNGGIYERWDDNRPDGHKGYDGHPPRLNASRAPGLWQHLKISFQAPRFDPSGKKVQSAKILQVELNGVVIHEDVELSGPTRGASGDESDTGPLRFQGDHGAVAFRNISVTQYGAGRPENKDDRPYRVYPILVKNSDHPVLRSFMDLPGGTRVVHAISVSSKEKIHYTYDADTGMIIQVWRGDFLDATPMWYSRGDGSARPAGAVLTFGFPALQVARLSSTQSPWKPDTTGTGFRAKGYVLDLNGTPTFHYDVYHVQVTDATQALSAGEGISRVITVSGSSDNLYVRLAECQRIDELAKNLYRLDDNSYYLRIDDTAAGHPIIRNGASGKKELIVPIRTQLSYTILF